MKLELPKGVRDLGPEDMLLKNELISKIKRVYENYGYAPLETPTFERAEVLGAKAAGDSESLNEWFTFQDQGKRDLALRYDLTVPFARFIAMNPTMKMPFKRYQVGQVYRDGPIKLGRFREFTQFDADVVGSKSMAADYEVVEMALAAYDALGMQTYIIVNNRKLLDELLAKSKVPEKQWGKSILVLDKIDKIGAKGVEDELRSSGLKEEQIESLLQVANVKGNNNEKLAFFEKLLGETEGIKELKEFFSFVTDERIKFEPALARGFSYYTGTVFEAYMKSAEVERSCGGGGRYNKLIAQLLGAKQEYPAVGFSIGLDVILTEMQQKRKGANKTPVQVYVVPIGTLKESMKITKELRVKGINVDIDLKNRGITKNLNYANSMGIKYCLIIGEDEIKAKKFKLKDMGTGKERTGSILDVMKLMS
ncbi:MAG: histidine--tRNA ligase [Candidatus Woesearchaeota archaeon]